MLSHWLVLVTSLFFTTCFVEDAVDPDRAERVREGKKFLNTSRLQEWEKVISQGVPALGKIVAKSSKRTLSEGWTQSKYSCVKYSDAAGDSFIDMYNPAYVARVKKKNGVYMIQNVSGAFDYDKTINLRALPFAATSCVGNTGLPIYLWLSQGKLSISDYRNEDGRHHIVLDYTDGSNRTPLEIVFDDKIDTVLPTEIIFDTTKKHHKTLFDFEVHSGFQIPTKLKEAGSSEVAITTFFPEEKLDTKACYLSYYGLPEPELNRTSDFGRSGNRYSLLYIGLAIICFGGVIFWVYRNQKER